VDACVGDFLSCEHMPLWQNSDFESLRNIVGMLKKEEKDALSLLPLKK